MKLTTALLAVFTFLGFSANAQLQEESRVKILPGTEPGIVKVHYVNEVNNDLEIKFITDAGIVGADKINGSFPNGVSRKYDVRNIKTDYRIEVSSAKMTLTYLIIPSKDRKTFNSYLEKSTFNHDVVASNN